MDRRDFLWAGASFTATAFLGACRSRQTVSSSSHPPLHLSGSTVFEESCTFFNSRVERRPQAVLCPNDIEDMLRGVEWARARGLPLAVRGGGHGGGRSAIEDDALLIDTRSMAGISDVELGTLILRGGVSTGALAEHCARLGTLAVVGSCSQVGYLGYMLNGGLSLMSRAHGLACDSLVAATIVTPDGLIIEADDTTQPDIMRCLRGGGAGNFGIVVAAKIRTHTPPPSVYGARVVTADARRDLLSRYIDDAAAHPPPMSSMLGIRAVSGGGIGAMLMVYRPAGNQVMGNADWNSMFKPESTKVTGDRMMSYREFEELLHDTSFPNTPYHLRSWFLSSDSLHEVSGPITDAISSGPLDRKPRVLIEQIGGKIRDNRALSSVYAHRNADFVLQAIANSGTETESLEAKEWLAEIASLLDLLNERACYANYADPIDRHDGITESEYFGSSASELAKLKNQLDPVGRMRGLVSVD